MSLSRPADQFPQVPPADSQGQVVGAEDEEGLADQLAELVVLSFLRQAQEEGAPPVRQLDQYLESLELHPPFLRATDFQDQASLERRLVGLPSFRRAVQSQRRQVRRLLELPDSHPEKLERARQLWVREALL